MPAFFIAAIPPPFIRRPPPFIRRPPSFIRRPSPFIRRPLPFSLFFQFPVLISFFYKQYQYVM